MEGIEIYKVTEKLIGPIQSYGSTHIDTERIENLKTAIDVARLLLQSISYASESKDRQEHSMREIGDLASKELKRMGEDFCYTPEVEKLQDLANNYKNVKENLEALMEEEKANSYSLGRADAEEDFTIKPAVENLCFNLSNGEMEVKFNGKPCKNGCNCIDVAEFQNGNEPVKNYACLGG